MQNILIVSNTKGMMVLTLKQQFEEKEFQVTLVNGDMKECSQLTDDFEAIILYLDDALAGNIQLLVYLRDQCIEASIPIIVIADPDEMDHLHHVVSADSIYKEYLRPFNVKEVAEQVSEELKEHGKQTKKKILVVDDSGAMLRNVKGWLEDKYQIILANSGAMAIKYLAINTPDLVLLDYEMPVVDGAQVLEMIRSEVDFADIPVIFLTSKNDKASISNVVKLKPEGYLLKTMKPEDIVKYVDDFFQKQKMNKI